MSEQRDPQAGAPARVVAGIRIGHRTLEKEIIGPPACPIMHRLKTRGGKLLLHHFLPNADDRAEHDHPSPFLTLVLRGGYDDRVKCDVCHGTRVYRGWTVREQVACPECGGLGDMPGDRMRRGMLRYRPAVYRHRTRVLPAGCWTVVWMFPKQRAWGFWKDGRWWPWRDHELAFGFGMRCPEGESDDGE